MKNIGKKSITAFVITILALLCLMGFRSPNYAVVALAEDNNSELNALFIL